MTAKAQDVDALIAAEKAKTDHQFADMLKEANSLQKPELAVWQRVLQAEAYVELNQHQSALAVLRDLNDWVAPIVSYTADGYAWLYKRALIASLTAKRALTKSTIFEATQLMAYYPLDKTIDSLLSDEEKNLPLLFEQKLAKMYRLAHVHAYKDIKNLLSPQHIKSSRLKSQDKCEAYYTLGRSLKGFQEHWDDAREALENVTNSRKCSDDLKARSLYYLGSLARATKNENLLIETYTKLYTNHPSHRLADDAVYFLVLYFEKTSKSQAKKYLKMLENYKTGDMRMVYHFKKGFDSYKKEKFSKAAFHFAKMNENTAPIDEVFAQGLYWHGRALEKQKSDKKHKEAKSLYKRLTKDYPFSFYAVLAAKQLNSKISVPKIPDFEDIAYDFLPNYFQLIDEFNEKGFSQGARVILDFILLKDPDLKNKNKHLFAKKFIESDNYREALDIAAEHFESGVYGPLNPQKDALFAAFYPKAYSKEIQKGYEVSSLPFGAIEGITREESLFRKDAVSWAGASGLMQLMPGTAQMIQKNVMAHTATTELTDPLNNILLGSHYLKRMQDRFDGQMPLAIMAYNAGPGNVNKWLRKIKKDAMQKELDVFIEEIPFSETRGYVKRVMRTMNIYGSLYEEDYFLKNMFSFQIQTN